eukprot:2700253-Lingulodinium_polyedra.AAC.1
MGATTAHARVSSISRTHTRMLLPTILGVGARPVTEGLACMPARQRKSFFWLPPASLPFPCMSMSVPAAALRLSIVPLLAPAMLAFHWCLCWFPSDLGASGA